MTRRKLEPPKAEEPKVVQLNLRISRSLSLRLEAIARERGVSSSEIARYFLEWGADEYEAEHEKSRT